MLKKIINFIGIIFLSIILFFLFIFIIIDKNIFNSKNLFYSSFPNIELRKYVFKKDSKMAHFYNDYNVRFLPFTQFEKLKYKKKKIQFENNLINQKNSLSDTISYKKYNSFYIDQFKNKIFLTDHLGHIYYFDQTNLFSSKKKIFAKNIKSDLEATRVFDAFIYKDNIFISYTLNKNKCNKIYLSYANINFENLKFKNLFNPDVCNVTGSPGRIQFFEKNGVPGLILSTSEGVYDNPGNNTQNKNSLFGKILFIPFNKDKAEMISLGHRVIQGLYSNDKTIIATEHGPRGGDEINLILENKNYGWPLVSLGERYDFKYGNKVLSYAKNHKENNFQEPIFSFIPSIGISDIIKLPETFSIYYDDSFLISSLNGKSIYFTKFNDEINKIISIEKVFIGNRVRDLKFISKNNSIIFALEENGEIGILSKN